MVNVRRSVTGGSRHPRTPRSAMARSRSSGSTRPGKIWTPASLQNRSWNSESQSPVHPPGSTRRSPPDRTTEQLVDRPLPGRDEVQDMDGHGRAERVVGEREHGGVRQGYREGHRPPALRTSRPSISGDRSTPTIDAPA